MCINCGKNIGFSLDNQKIENVINIFVTNMGFQHIDLPWIIQSNQKLDYDFHYHSPPSILNEPWYNTAICSKSHGFPLEYYVTTSIQER